MNTSELERELERKWRASPLLYAPLELQQFSFEQVYLKGRIAQETDLTFDLSWGAKKVSFVGEVKMSATPQTCRRALEHLTYSVLPNDALRPALITTYLSPGIVEQLEAMQVSGLDLNGNYYIMTPELVAVRLDQQNQYPSSRDIKKIFSSNSSIVSRFLLRENRTFGQVNDIAKGIEECGGGVSLSTISKVLKGLEDELLIDRSDRTIRVLQPDKMLERLKSGYQRPSINERLKLKLPGEIAEMSELLGTLLGDQRWIWSGESSAQRYGTTTSESVRKVYTSASIARLEVFKAYQDNRFYNCVVEPTNDDYIYFDSDGFWASRIETYLALSQLDKREQQVADEIAQQILREFK